MAQTQETKRIKFSREVALRKNFSHRLSPGTARNEDTSGIESQVNFTFVVNAASQNRDSSDTLTPRRSAVYNDVRNWRSAFEKLADYKRRIWEIYLTCHASHTVLYGGNWHPRTPNLERASRRRNRTCNSKKKIFVHFVLLIPMLILGCLQRISSLPWEVFTDILQKI